MYRLVSFTGMLVLVAIAFLISNNKKRISFRVLFLGITLQVFFALIILPNSPLNRAIKSSLGTETAPGEVFFAAMNDAVIKLLSFAEDGSRFVFGNLVYNQVPVMMPTGPDGRLEATAGAMAQTGAYFAFNVLPTIIFFSSLMGVLYYLGVMQKVVAFFAKIMEKFLGTSGAETLSASANIFVGQTEAPLVVRPYVNEMTVSELMVVMVGGFATVAGGVMAAYVGMLKDYFPDIAGHLISASIMSAPAGIVMAKLMYPETEVPKTMGGVRVKLPKTNVNIIDAAASGAGTGLTLALNVGAMLLAFIALVSMANFLIEQFGYLLDLIFGITTNLSLDIILGWVFSPLAWVMGVPWADCETIGRLLGEKMAINEFVAYASLANLLESGAQLHERSIVIATYALCGFANFSSIAIQIGGIGGIAPKRRHDLARIGFKAMIGGTLAAFMTGTIAGIFM
ncbi:MAG: nucleoside transporter C-terminal domain-containing protein [Candidatus Erginobacter occultus]|nr:nucleoside transporter C-terminal domain-containing protein [Candidatus Erginobacter occultus]